MGQLFVLQKLQFDACSRTSESQAQIEKLRETVPTPIVAHYDRLVLRGKKGVAIARNGVCSECHLRIPIGKLASLFYTNEIHQCDNCGRYLYLPEDEPVGLIDPKPAPPAPVRQPSRTTAQHVA